MRWASRLKRNADYVSELRIPIMRDIAIVTVQYRNEADTAAFAGSLASLDDASSCELVIVDNSPEAATRGADKALEQMPFIVHAISTHTNLYYWGGAMHAIDGIRRSGGSLPRWVIVCNNDITFPDVQFLKRLAGFDPEQYPIIAPGVLSAATNRDQNPLLRTEPGILQRTKWRIYDSGYPLAQLMLALHRPIARLRNNFRSATTIGARTMVYAPHGAFVIFSSAFFERGGVLDTTVPMFAEELTIAETARGLGLPIWHVPDLRVVHREHSTTGVRLTRSKYHMETMARRRYYEVRRGNSAQ